MGKPVVTRYLERFAEPLALRQAGVLNNLLTPYNSAFVVPAFAEPISCLARVLEGKSGCKKRLVIMVLNERFSSSGQEKEDNQALLRHCLNLKSHQSETFNSRELVFLRAKSDAPDLLLLNALGAHGFSEKQGVGLARKLGFDLALLLYERGLIQSPYIGSSDADARLESWRFRELEEAVRGYSGLVFDFQHRTGPESAAIFDPKEAAAMMQLEAGFRYYALGLAHAGSPYCYTALGSSLAVDALAYAQVRGVPKRQAGEDFYLLAKLSQVGPLRRVAGHSVQIMSRRSTRVPFGTGRSLLELERIGHIEVVPPQAFEALRKNLLWGATGAECGDFSVLKRRADTDWMYNFFEARASLGPEKLKSLPGRAQRRLRFFEQFNALKQRQFLSEIQERLGGPISLEEALHQSGLSNKRGQKYLVDCIDWASTSAELQHLSSEVLPLSCGPGVAGSLWNFPSELNK